MPFAQANGISIILFASDEQADALLQLVRDWTSVGLLSSAVWVRPSHIREHPTGPPEVHATVIGSDDHGGLVEQEIDLFAMLAQQSVRRVRIIKLRAPLYDPSSDRLQDLNSVRVIRYIQYSMPQVGPLQSGDDDAVDVTDFSLICAPTEVQLDDRLRDAERESALVLVASPEDRSMPGAGDAFIRQNERFAGFVLLHVAAAAGLWRGTPHGTFDLVQREGSLVQGIWAQRVFARAVLTQGIARRAGRRLLREVVEQRGRIMAAGVPLVPEGTTLIPAEHNDRYVAELVDAAMALDEGALEFHRPPPAPTPMPEQVGILEAFGRFLRFAGGKFARIPHWMRLWGRDLVARQLIKGLQDRDSLQQISLLLDQEPDGFDRKLLLTARRVADAERSMREPSAHGLAAKATSVSGSIRVWSRLRQLVFGALDGGELGAEGTFNLIDGRSPVFESINPITPDPASSWRASNPPDGFPATLTFAEYRADPGIEERLQQLVADANEASAAAAELLVELQQRHASCVVELEEMQSDLVDAGHLRVRADGRVVVVAPKGDSEDEEAQQARAAHDERIDEWNALNIDLAGVAAEVADQESAVQAAESHAQGAGAAYSAFQAWLEPLRRTFVVQLGDRLRSVHQEARAQLDAAPSFAVSLPEMRELIRLRKRFHLTLLLSTLIVGLLALAVFALPWLIEQGTSNQNPNTAEFFRALQAELDGRLPGPEIFLYGLILLLVVWLVAAAAYYRSWSSLEWRVQLADHAVGAHTQRLRALRAEVARLESLHAQTTRWLDILGSVLDHPWQPPASWLDEERTEVDTSRMPYAFEVAHAIESSGMGEDRLLREAAARLLRKGWRTEALQEILNEIADKLGEDRARLSFSVLDQDQPDAPNHSTDKVQTYMGAQDLLESIAQRRLAALVGEVQPMLYRGERTRVEAIARVGALAASNDAAARTKGWLEFLHQPVHGGPVAPTPLSALGIALESQQQAHHQEVESYVVASESVIGNIRDSFRETLHLAPVGGEATEIVDTLIRLDVAGPMPFDAVQALYRPARAVEVPEGAASEQRSGI